MRQDCIVELVLDKESSERLKFGYAHNSFEKVYCHHVTLAYKPDSESEVYKYALEHEGESITITVYGVGRSEQAEAFRVLLPIGVPCENSQPHITIGTFHGGKPVDSNKITNWENLENPFLVIGKVTINRFS